MSTLITLEVLESFTVQQDGQVTTWQPGQRKTLPIEKVQRVIKKVSSKVRICNEDDEDGCSMHEPIAPLLPGWLVAYYGLDERLHGGSDDRQHGTVWACVWDGRAWTVLLTDGQRLALGRIRSVGQVNKAGLIIAVWSTEAHGIDGNGRL